MGEVYDVAVIGAGPGGYTAALRAAQLGLRVVCIDAWTRNGLPSPGGTCLNVGCIPSKALLESSAFYQRLRREGSDHGIQLQDSALSFDTGVMQSRKERIVGQLTRGVQALFKKQQVTFIHGRAAFQARDDGGFTLQVLDPSGALSTVKSRQVLLATGSEPRALAAAPWVESRIVDSAGALALSQVPARLGIIGAGVIGVELGSVWSRLGSRVTLLEAQPTWLPNADREVAETAWRELSRQTDLTLELGISLHRAQPTADGVRLQYVHEGQDKQLDVGVLVVAVGRVPCTAGLELERVGLACDERGGIPVDENCRTAVAGIWAIGDVVRGPMLAHKAEEEGVAVAERMAGQQPLVDFGHIPWVIYTEPEIAWVGLGEEAARQAGYALRIGRFPFAANARARARGAARGLVKVIACASTDRILGVHIVGPEASELIAEAVAALAFKASSEDMARIPHAHPSLAEAFREACLGVDGRTLNV